jgi:FkbM family methyltransferase
MSLLNTLKFITNHPLNRENKVKAIIRFIRWQISVRLNPYPIIFPYAEKTKLIISRGMHGATGNLYCGLDEFEEMAFLLHFLRKDDLFIDIGANVGSYTLLASNEVGAETISIEPIPVTYKKLKENIWLNNLENKVKTLNIGLGSEKGVLKFTKALDTINHVATENEPDTIDVQIEKFDGIINFQKPTLIKIDVEGFETEVLNGMGDALLNPYLKGIIIELNGSGNRYGFKEDEIHKKLISHNFKSFNYSPFKRKLVKTDSFGSGNTIYIKDTDFVYERVSSAKKFKIADQEI